MVVEKAQLFIKPGQEKDFEQAMQRGREVLAGLAGCQSVSLARGVENPASYLLLIEWDSVDAHVDATKTEPFAEFRALAGPHFDGPAAMEHFAPVE
jgi:heme-degrading monooxygenase HmoA